MSAAEYIEHGWALCQFKAGTKGAGNVVGWNLPHNAIRTVAQLKPGAHNVGLLHAWSGTCAIDLDKADKAREWLADHGIDMDALLLADDAVQPRSGSENKGKLLYKLPAGVNPLDMRTVQIKGPDSGMWMEFRCATECGTKTVQDVLPPSTHPDTGRAYEWGGAGDWRELPTLPVALLDVWREHIGHDKRVKGTGPGTSAEVMAFVARLEEKGLKPYRIGKSVRSYCPHHGGVSGTSLKVDEGEGGTLLAHCKAGCTFDEVTKALGSVPQSTQAPPRPPRELPASVLPAFPDELLALPHGLGVMQSWILGQMKYPSPSTAGIGALAVLAHVAMGSVTVDSYAGLGLNEQFLVLAPTGFGKEDLRAPFGAVDKYLRALPVQGGNIRSISLPHLQYSAPASQQGLHKLLETHARQTFLADEFAEWLGHTSNDSHKQQALGHFMQAYTRAMGTLSARHAITTEYKPVENPRVLVFATSTAERMLEAMSASQAESGALNRFVVHVAEQERIQKRYTGMRYTMPLAVSALVEWVYLLDDTKMGFTADAWELYTQHDSAVIEPLRHADNVLAARLSEQAIKIAALIALSDQRTQIDLHDLAVAYRIREGLYHRAASLIGSDGAISGMHETGKALAQLADVFTRRPTLYRSQLAAFSKKYKALSLPERAAVVNALIAEGVVHVPTDRHGCLVSNVCEVRDAPTADDLDAA